MKKVRYSFISFLLVVVCATINAQMYTRTAARTYGTPALGENGLSQDPFTQRGALKIGGTSGFWYGPTGLQVESRGVELYNDTWGIDDYPKNPATASRPDPNSLGFWWWNYMDISDKTSDIEIVSGQEFTVKSPVNYYWTNAVAFVDWDGNGSFDDHDPLLYDKYGQVTYALIEYSGATITSSFLADWTFIAPNVSEERKVRIRIRADIGVAEDCFMKRRAINGFNGNELGIPKCNYVQEKITNDKNNQNFMPMNLHRFFPTAEGRKGGTLDFTVTIKPDPYSTTTPQPKETIAGAGNVAAACQTSQGTAISDAAGFLAFMNATSGDYYLANDITLTSVPVSQTTFSGTFDGNGHTITFSSAATATISGKAKDECFYPYGNSDTQISQNLFIEKQPGGKYPAVDMTNYPERAIAGGFCGVLARGAVIKNVKVVYNANATYNNTSGVAPIFGLVAGINKGHIENVSIDIPAGKTVKLQNSGKPTASAFGGITGLLYRGVVKHCAVNIDGTMSHDAANAMQETLTSAFIGRLQVGIVSNVKFSGSGTMYANSSSVNYVRNYMGGIAGMTNTPKGEFCGDEDFNRQLKSWGYDNGTRGLDVNNVILSYTGAMNMANAGNNGSYAYNCRGLLFAEAYDTIVVPNLVTQYAALPTIEMEAPAAASLSGANIPLISNTKGIYSAMVAFCNGVQDENNTPRLLGKVYLYKDARFSDDSAKGDKFTNINVADTEVDWAYEYDPNTCSYYSTPYAVATYTGTNANVQGIESASANVSDLGNTMVKIDPQPETVASPSWTWSETATPPAAEPIETPICGGGSGTTTLPLLTYCTPGNQGDSGQAGQRSITSFTINGTTIAVNETSANYSPAYRGYKNSEANAIEVTPGQTFTISSIHQDNWIHINAFVDWNHDGVFERIGRSPNDNLGGAASFTVTVPNDAAIAYTPLRLMLAWLDVNDACTFSSPDNPCIAVDIVLKVIESAYCAQPTFASHTTGTTATGYLKNLTANGEALATNWNSNQSQNTVGKTITINPGGNLNLNFTFQCDWSNNNVDDKGLNWTTAFAFVDLNGDGDFTDSGERIYARGGGGCNRANDAILPDGRTGSDATWTGTKTVTLTATSKSMLRIYTLGEYNDGFVQSTNGSKAAFDTGCATGGFNGDSGSNKFHCYDFPIVINSAVGGDGCAYVHDFGSVAAGSDVTYEMNLGAVVAIVKDSTLAAPFTATASGEKLIINYSPEAVGSHEAGFRISLDGGEEFPVSLTGTGVRYPNVTFRQGENGGGALSLDMGKTKFIESRELAPYKGELLTAVPVGPTHITGWYYSTDGGTTWTDVGHANPDYTYTGADDAIVEVRFDFDEFEGDFGNSRFTDNSNVPFYISAISTTDGIVNVDATNVFTDATVAGGSAHLRYMENQRLQTLHKSLKTLTHNVTVTVQNANKIPADARLMCFIDYNMNNYFDFASSPDGLASGLIANGELVFVADPNDTEATQTFTFQISNTGIDQFGKTRMRFMVATYVDMYGLGPVNQYGNYQPRIDTDGDGIADTNLTLNDNNGLLYTPENQCRYVNYVNVADVNFEVVAYIRSNDEYVIRNGESIRLGDLYIESVEDETGINSGTITFDKSAPYGSLSVEGNIVVRKRIYQDRWHDVAFPIAMQGTSGDKGVCAVAANSSLQKLPDDMWLLKQFNPTNKLIYNSNVDISKRNKLVRLIFYSLYDRETLKRRIGEITYKWRKKKK